MMLRTPTPRHRRVVLSAELDSVQLQSQSPDDARLAFSATKRTRIASEIDEENDDVFSLRSLRRRASLDGAQPFVMYQELHSHEPEYHCEVARERLESQFGEDESYPWDWDSLRCTYKCRNLVKSEVLETLELKEKKVLELESVTKSLQHDYRAAEEERKRLQKRVELLEQGLAAATGREQASYKQRAHDFELVEKAIQSQLERCGELQTRLQEEMRLRTDAQAASLAFEALSIAAEEEKQRVVESSQREVRRVREELERLQIDNRFSVAKINAENLLEKGRARSAAAESELLHGQLEDMKIKVAQRKEKQLEQEHEVAETASRTCTRSTDATEAELIIKQLRDELSCREAEVREARKLKQFYVNSELLKEQLESERIRADRAEASFSNLADLELKVKYLESELDSWAQLTKELPGVQRQCDVILRFAELQRDVIAAVGATGEANAKVAELQITHDKSENARRQLEAVLAVAKAEAADAAANLKRVEHKVSLLSKERDGLKAVIASYDEEETIIASHKKPGGGVGAMPTPEHAKEIRIQNLESALVDAQTNSEMLGDELERSLAMTTELRHQNESLELKFVEAQKKIKALECESEQLRSEVSVLDAKVQLHY